MVGGGSFELPAVEIHGGSWAEVLLLEPEELYIRLGRCHTWLLPWAPHVLANFDGQRLWPIGGCFHRLLPR